jgi:phosphatidate cytidylyltransferase
VLRQRAIGAAVFVPVILLALIVGGPVLVAVVALGTGIAAWETFRLLRAAGYPSFWAMGAVLAVALVVDAALPELIEDGGLLLVAVGAVLVAMAAFVLPDPRDGLATWLTTVFGALYASLLAFVVRLGDIAPAVPATAPFAGLGAERGWIVLLVLAVWSYDTGAFFVGRQFGRARFLEHLSPSKTWAGLIGGLVATTIVVAILLVALGRPALGALLLGPLIGLAAQAGDLAESMLKRAAGAKDSSNLIPGHGGVLDRVDSFLFAAPAVTFYVAITVR